MREVISKVVHKKEIECEEKDGRNITENNFAVEIIKLGYHDIDKKCDDQEETADASTDGVYKTKRVQVLIKTG